MTDHIAVAGCSFCTGTLPTILLKTRFSLDNVRVRMCRDCILVALSCIENPTEYPCAIEDRDVDLAVLAQAKEQGAL
jgi:hypothetical protein